jgi:hypothetical protein
MPVLSLPYSSIPKSSVPEAGVNSLFCHPTQVFRRSASVMGIGDYGQDTG